MSWTCIAPQVQDAQVTYSLRLMQSKPIFTALEALINNTALFNTYTEAQQRAVTLKHRDFVLSGAKLQVGHHTYMQHAERLSLCVQPPTHYAASEISTAVNALPACGTGPRLAEVQ